MIFLKNKVLKFVVLALVFSVAVSGGCGGGGGGHYSGDFGGSGDSSENTTTEDFTTEYVSPDVMPAEPEEPALSDQFGDENADDEYGAGKIPITAFTLLNKTTWNIDRVSISHHPFSLSDTPLSIDVPERNNYNTKKITFLISGDFGMAWATENAKKEPHSDNLSIQIKDGGYNFLQWVPLFRFSDRFSHESSYLYEAHFSRSGVSDSESIEITEHFDDTPLVAKKIRVMGEFTSDETDQMYMPQLELSRVDNFSILDQTDWQIKSIDVIGFVKDDNGNYVYGEPQNYQVIKRDKVNKITLRTSFENNVGVLNFITDDKNTIASNPLILNFNDTTLGGKKLITLQAPFLRPASGFQIYTDINTDNPVKAFEAFKADVNTGTLPGREVMYISNYGPNGYVTICNSVCYYKKNDTKKKKNPYHYWVTLVLEPYNPNK